MLVVDYDKEKELKKQLGVRSQAPLTAYKGGVEKARLAGDTDPEKLRAALLSAN